MLVFVFFAGSLDISLLKDPISPVIPDKNNNLLAARITRNVHRLFIKTNVVDYQIVTMTFIQYFYV